MIKRIGALVFALTLLFAFSVPASAADPVELPDDYIQYEYIESTASEYLNLGYRPTNNTRVEITFEYLGDNNSYLYGCSGQGGYYANFIQYQNGNYVFYYGNQSYTFTNLSTSGILTFSFDGTTASIGGQSITIPSQSFNCVQPLFVFSSSFNGNPNTYCHARIYSMKIHEGSVLKMDLVPASNGTSSGLYDVVGGTFFGNVSSNGGFIDGPTVSTGPSVADTITDLNTQIHDIESTIYEDLHTYSAQVDPSTATNFSGNFLSAMSFISNTWTSAYNQLGDMQVIVTFPLFLAIAMLFIGRMNSVIASGAMKSRKNNDKKGGGDVG